MEAAAAAGARGGLVLCRNCPMHSLERDTSGSPCRPRSTSSAASRTISARSSTTRRPAPARPSTRRRKAPILAALDETGWTLSDILVTHRHADHVQGIAALKQRTGCRVVAPAEGGGQVPAVDAWCARATRCMSATFRPMSGRRPAIAPTTSPTGSRPTGRCLRATPCSRSAAAGCSRAAMRRCGRRSSASRRCPTRRGSIRGHDYVLSNARFALAADPRQRGPARRAPRRPSAPRREGRFLVPSTIGEEKATNPLPARRRAGPRPLPSERRAPSRQVFQACANGRTGSDPPAGRPERPRMSQSATR